MIKNISLLITCLIFYSCHVSGKMASNSPKGEMAVVLLKNGQNINAELVAISDTSIVLKSSTALTLIHFKQVESISLNQLFKSTTKYVSGFILLIAEAVLFANDDENKIAIGLLGAATTYSFFFHNPKTHFSIPLAPDEKMELQKYCRYPLGITREQLNALSLQF